MKTIFDDMVTYVRVSETITVQVDPAKGHTTDMVRQWVEDNYESYSNDEHFGVAHILSCDDTIVIPTINLELLGKKRSSLNNLI